MEMNRSERDYISVWNMKSGLWKDALSAGRTGKEDSLADLMFGTHVWKHKLRLTKDDPRFERSWEQINMKAAQAVSEPLPVLSYTLFRQFAETGERKAYEDVYFERRARLSALAVIAAVATDDKEKQHYISALENVIWDICGEYTWCLTAHLPLEGDPIQEVDLFAAETAQTLAEIYAMYEGELDKRVAKRIRSEVRRRVLTPVFSEKRPFSWRNADHNWSAVCAGGSGMAALLLMDDPLELAGAVEQVLHSLQSFLSGYGMDGGCAEGLGYWVYGFGYFTYFSEMLREYTLHKIDLLATPHTQSIAGFPSAIHLSDGMYVNFSDSSEREVLPPGLLSRLAERTGCIYEIPFFIPGLMDDPVHRWAHLIRNFLWSDVKHGMGEQPSSGSIIDPVSADERSILETWVFSDLNWWVSKGIILVAGMSEMGELSQRDQQSHVTAGFALKGGHNGEPHNHNDLGQFIIHAGGENLLCDLGAGMYTKAYFQEGRESIVNISSGGHNVPIIDGQKQRSGSQYSAKVLESYTDRKAMKVLLDLTNAYSAEQICRFTRSVLFRCPSGEDRAILQLEDVFEWEERAQAVEERLISRISPVIGLGHIVWRGRRAVLSLRYDSSKWTASCKQTAHYTHEGEPFTFYTTSLVNKDRSDKESRCSLEFEIKGI